MIIFKSINKLNKKVNFKAPVGFVPTMGSLHKGHISLIKSSKKKCSKTLVSIFINPSQFNKKSDHKNYPRNIKKDIMILKKMNVDYLLLPKLNEILGKIKGSILDWSKIPLLAKTHGQPASPTFMGKEMLVFYERLVIQARKLNGINYTTKFGGANGNFNAHHMALPNIDWIEFANKFVQIFGLERNQYTTQIDHYDNYAEIFDILRRINVIL